MDTTDTLSSPEPAAAKTPRPENQTVPPSDSSSTESLTAMTESPGTPMADMSVPDMFLSADLVVQGVMLVLLLASVATWAIIIEKAALIIRFRRVVRRFGAKAAENSGQIDPDGFPKILRPVVRAGLIESEDSAGNESRADYRERVERAMRTELTFLMDRLSYRTMFLATVGAVSPFVGLLGTVWGIMHSFVGIAASGETTLAVVAPGIAEALFATALGLVAAIPAVMAFNKINGSLKLLTKTAAKGIGRLGNRLARGHFRERER